MKIYDSPHIQPLYLVTLLAEDPVPPEYLRPPRLLYQSSHFHHENSEAMSHHLDQVQYSGNLYSSIKPSHPYQSHYMK
jgi:hypothetical protein